MLRGGKTLRRTVIGTAALRSRLRAAPWIVMRSRREIAAAHRTRSALRRPTGRAELAAGQAGSLLHQHALLEPDELPDRILCTVVGARSRARIAIPVRRFHPETTLRLPVRGRWVVLAAHRHDEPHAWGRVDSQRFAYDLSILTAGGTSYRGDGDNLTDYPAYGAPVLAAADGRVVAVHDGVPDNPRPGRRPSWRELLVRTHDLAGNFVVLAHRGGEHTAYLHLQPKLHVALGQRVAQGAPLGTCGNSGNSTEPHLHFQLEDGPDPLRAGGLPALLSSFTVFRGRSRLYVGPERALPLPLRWPLQHGKAPGAIDAARALSLPSK